MSLQKRRVRIEQDEPKPRVPLMSEQSPFVGYQLPPLAWLRAFEAAARHESFTLAATELSLTQAAVSHQVRSLEKHLGVTLFERLPRSLRLTEKGAAYLPPLRNSFDELAAATAGLFGPVGKRNLTLRVPISFMALWLAPRLPKFVAQWPDISLRISTVVWAPAASDDVADVDIRFGDGRWPGLKASLLMRQPAIVVAAPNLIQGNDDAERMRALLDAPSLIHVTGYENLWQRFLKLIGVSLPASAGINVDTTISALEMAAAGLGPALIQSDLAEPFLKSGRLARALDASIALDEAHYIVQPESQRRVRPEAMLFRDWLAKEAAGG
ncbi:LysR substrate-binding domain-containing protein [Rhizobium sp. G21]|uniref:LysR substrate-binding domain-containing protein n=1 Tax=Rhizobium sp. G21 TaxID=2758439 RepID=UPI001602FE09|nr:LysR substrate-binding domain-containing protein [Rhizobium sp. G21]MBB1249865.1 LysR family transcriptional regulator [Rhizobium sp. G21]